MVDRCLSIEAVVAGDRSHSWLNWLTFGVSVKGVPGGLRVWLVKDFVVEDSKVCVRLEYLVNLFKPLIQNALSPAQWDMLELDDEHIEFVVEWRAGVMELPFAAQGLVGCTPVDV